MPDLVTRIREYVESVPPVDADLIMTRFADGSETPADRPVWWRTPLAAVVGAALLALVLIGGAALLWAALGADEAVVDEPPSVPETTFPSSTTLASTTIPPPASSTTLPPSSTTQPVTTTSVPIEENVFFPPSLPLDASLVVGALPAPPGWSVTPGDGGWLGIDDGCIIEFPPGEVIEEGESCVTNGVAGVHIGVFPIAGITGSTGEPDLSLEALAAGYLTPHARELNSWLNPELMEPEPARVGALEGLHYRWRTQIDGEVQELGEAYFATDATFLYVIQAQFGELDPDDLPVHGVEMFTPYLREIVADLAIPLTAAATSSPPVVAPDWVLQEGDVIVAGPDGVTILRGEAGSRRVVAAVTAEPTMQAYHDRMAGIVVQRAHPRESAGVMGGEAGIWWIPDASTAPILLHLPDPGRPAALYGVGELGGAPMALYTTADQGERFVEQVLVAHDLRNGTVHRIGSAGEGEVGTSCVAAAGDLVVLSKFAEENTWFEWFDFRGNEIVPSAELPAALQWSGQYRGGGPCATLSDSGNRAAVAFRDWDDPNQLVLVDLTTTAETGRFSIDEVLIAETAADEIAPFHRLESRLDFAGDSVLISTLVYGDDQAYVVSPEGSVEDLPILGAAAWVRQVGGRS